MKNVKLIILSDIHLERVTELKQKLLLSEINKKIEIMKEEGFTPIVVFAGDVNNYTDGYSFMSNIDAKIIYIAGNHEFWGKDYYETIDALKNNSPQNVRFLHNDIVVVGDYIILGATLWTDVGESLNKDLFIHASNRMNDMSYIGAKKWYENNQNIKKLEKAYSGYYYEEKIENKRWNALIEIEENKKSWNFLSYSNDVLKVINKVREKNKKLNKDLDTKSDWWRIDKKIFIDTKQKIDIRGADLSWEFFIENLSSLYKNYNISEEEKNLLLLNKEEKNKLFQKIRFIENIEDKKIIILSHHLPFYEEILVGTIMDESVTKKIKLHNTVDGNLFLIRSGEEYPDFNYLDRASKGEMERNNDITHVVNYYNDGSNKLGDFLLNNTKIWIHGHEHNFRYEDYVKGIKIITNPSGTSLSVLDVVDNKITINKHYMDYHKIKEDCIPDVLSKVIETLFRIPSDSLLRDDLHVAVQLWALKHYDWDMHILTLKKIERASKEILLLSVEYLKIENSEHEYVKNSGIIEEKLGMWTDAYNYNRKKLQNLHNELLLAFSVRVEKNFNFQSYSTQSLMTMINIPLWTMGGANMPEVITDGLIGIFSAKKSFEAKGNIKIALKYAEKINIFFKSKTFINVYQIIKKDVDDFSEFNKSIISQEKIMLKLDEKWKVFYGKSFEIV